MDKRIFLLALLILAAIPGANAQNPGNPPYHHPKDEWRDDWDMSGVMDHWNLIHALIQVYANQPEMPVWNPGAGFSRPKINQ